MVLGFSCTGDFLTTCLPQVCCQIVPSLAPVTLQPICLLICLSATCWRYWPAPQVSPVSKLPVSPWTFVDWVISYLKRSCFFHFEDVLKRTYFVLEDALDFWMRQTALKRSTHHHFGSLLCFIVGYSYLIFFLPKSSVTHICPSWDDLVYSILFSTRASWTPSTFPVSTSVLDPAVCRTDWFISIWANLLSTYSFYFSLVTKSKYSICNILQQSLALVSVLPVRRKYRFKGIVYQVFAFITFILRGGQLPLQHHHFALVSKTFSSYSSLLALSQSVSGISFKLQSDSWAPLQGVLYFLILLFCGVTTAWASATKKLPC